MDLQAERSGFSASFAGSRSDAVLLKDAISRRRQSLRTTDVTTVLLLNVCYHSRRTKSRNNERPVCVKKTLAKYKTPRRVRVTFVLPVLRYGSGTLRATPEARSSARVQHSEGAVWPRAAWILSERHFSKRNVCGQVSQPCITRQIG